LINSSIGYTLRSIGDVRPGHLTSYCGPVRPAAAAGITVRCFYGPC